MGNGRAWLAATLVAVVLAPAGAHLAHAQQSSRHAPRAVAQTRLPPTILPEQRRIQARSASRLPPTRLPSTPRPATVSDPRSSIAVRTLPLDEAIEIALANSSVVRVLAGVTAVASGQSVYDPAISNTAIDEERGRFDPTFEIQNNFNRFETPLGILDTLDPSRAFIAGSRTDDYDMRMELSKTTATGGTARLGASSNDARFRPGVFPLNPQDQSSADLSFTQPFLQGGGLAVNVAPIVIARIDTERSYFRLKDSVQELVRGVIEAYWGLVFARTDVWARRRQYEQGQAASERAQARLDEGLIDIAEVSQTRLAAANFRANLIAAEANLQNREAALRNILGLPPADDVRLVPATPPVTDFLDVDWQALVALAGEERPDLVELKLIIEADRQLLLQATNQALPRADALMLYRWNGLEGRAPDSADLATRPGQFTDWTLGINFSVPLGLRQARAGLRRQELLLVRDRANLAQGGHNATHALAASLRNLAQFHEQYVAFRETRIAARVNLDQQAANYLEGRSIFLNVLQAITDWGNSVSAEANSLAQYNSELANLERESGTILETHGIRFSEERYGSIGPLGRLFDEQLYPRAMRPLPGPGRYPSTDTPSETMIEIDEPALQRNRTPEEIPSQAPERDRETLPEPPLPSSRRPPRPASPTGFRQALSNG